MERLSNSQGPVKVIIDRPYNQSINGNINLNFYNINKQKNDDDDSVEGSRNQTVENLELQKRKI